MDVTWFVHKNGVNHWSDIGITQFSIPWVCIRSHESIDVRNVSNFSSSISIFLFDWSTYIGKNRHEIGMLSKKSCVFPDQKFRHWNWTWCAQPAAKSENQSALLPPLIALIPNNVPPNTQPVTGSCFHPEQYKSVVDHEQCVNGHLAPPAPVDWAPPGVCG